MLSYVPTLIVLNEQFEFIFVEVPVINNTNKSLLFGVVYCSPSGDMENVMLVLMIC